jgi:hypothetical protein
MAVDCYDKTCKFGVRLGRLSESDAAGRCPAGPGADDQRQRQQSDRHDGTTRTGEVAVVSKRTVSGNTGILALDQAGQL